MWRRLILSATMLVVLVATGRGAGSAELRQVEGRVFFVPTPDVSRPTPREHIYASLLRREARLARELVLDREVYAPRDARLLRGEWELDELRCQIRSLGIDGETPAVLDPEGEAGELMLESMELVGLVSSARNGAELNYGAEHEVTRLLSSAKSRAKEWDHRRPEEYQRDPSGRWLRDEMVELKAELAEAGLGHAELHDLAVVWRRRSLTYHRNEERYRAWAQRQEERCRALEGGCYPCVAGVPMEMWAKHYLAAPSAAALGEEPAD